MSGSATLLPNAWQFSYSETSAEITKRDKKRGHVPCFLTCRLPLLDDNTRLSESAGMRYHGIGTEAANPHPTIIFNKLHMPSKNKVAIVTGAKQGIGLGIALALAKEGCSVVVSDLEQAGCEKAAAKLKKLGVKTLAVACDVSKKDQVDNLVAKTMKKFGRLDILINNAGIFPFVSFADMKEADWDKVLDVNLKSVFLCSQAAVKHMKPGGKIVSISSIASLVGFEGLVHYCASKGGINGLTRALALELASKKINVNAVAPGAIETPGASSTEEEKKQTVAAIPWGRMGKPEDIAQAVVFLASDKADYITGQVLVVDGGWTLR